MPAALRLLDPAQTEGRLDLADAAEQFSLPRDRTVIMGSHIDV